MCIDLISWEKIRGLLGVELVCWPLRVSFKRETVKCRLSKLFVYGFHVVLSVVLVGCLVNRSLQGLGRGQRGDGRHGRYRRYRKRATLPVVGLFGQLCRNFLKHLGCH